MIKWKAHSYILSSNIDPYFYQRDAYNQQLYKNEMLHNKIDEKQQEIDRMFMQYMSSVLILIIVLALALFTK